MRHVCLNNRQRSMTELLHEALERCYACGDYTYQHKDKIYETYLLRRSYREDGKVKNETLANLSYFPPTTIQLIKESLAGKTHQITDM